MVVNEMLNKLDYLYSIGDLKQAEKQINQWLDTAISSADYGTMLTLYNEMEGLYRTTGRAGEAAEISDKALDIINKIGLVGTVHHATTLLNGATANRWDGNIEKALDMYLQAKEIYTNLHLNDSYNMASLYNNISHIYQQKNLHEKALENLYSALDIVSKLPDNDCEIATTKITISLSYMALGNIDKAKESLDEAFKYFNSDEGTRDSHLGSALSALGEYFWRTKDYEQAVFTYNKALDFIKNRFGESAGYNIILNNLKLIEKEQKNNQ